MLLVFNLGMLIYVQGLPRGASLTDPESGSLVVALSLWAIFDLMILVAWISGWPRRCPACDFPNSGESRYSECRRCGHDWAATYSCPECSVFNLPSRDRCSGCGTDFEIVSKKHLFRPRGLRTR